MKITANSYPTSGEIIEAQIRRGRIKLYLLTGAALLCSVVQYVMLHDTVQLLITVGLCVLVALRFKWARVLTIIRCAAGIVLTLWQMSIAVGDMTVEMELTGDTAVGKAWLLTGVLLAVAIGFGLIAQRLAYSRDVQMFFYDSPALSRNSKNDD